VKLAGSGSNKKIKAQKSLVEQTLSLFSLSLLLLSLSPSPLLKISEFWSFILPLITNENLNQLPDPRATQTRTF
jgi:hypothetical protein